MASSLRSWRDIPRRIGEAAWLDQAAGALQGGVHRMVPHGPVKDALSGTWLGHPAHPPLTDLAIGFWTSAWVLDLVPLRRTRTAADALVALGLASAIPTAATGASDWADTSGPARRVGVVHASLNVTAVACYSASLWCRRRGRRGRGVAWGMAGATAATAGAWLGGHLVDVLGVGVDNTAFHHAPADWTPVAGASPPTGEELVGGEAGGLPVVVARVDGRLVALDSTCTHRGGPLHDGSRDGNCVVCPWHGSRFRLADGRVEQGPATSPQPRLEVRERDGRLEVRAAPAPG